MTALTTPLLSKILTMRDELNDMIRGLERCINSGSHRAAFEISENIKDHAEEIHCSVEEWASEKLK